MRTDCTFLNDEVAALRESIRNRISIIENDIRSAIVFTGAAWAWILTHNTLLSGFFTAATLIPFFITLLLLYKYKIQHRAIREIAEYVMMVENHFNLPKDFGWEMHVERNREVKKSLKRHVNFIMHSLNILNIVGFFLIFISGHIL